MFLKASHSGRGGAQSATERAFLYEFLPSQSAYADSSPKGGASKKLTFKCYKVVGEPSRGLPYKNAHIFSTISSESLRGTTS